MKKPHKKLPDLTVLESLFDYDPNTGGLYRKGAEPCEVNTLGAWLRSGHRSIYVKGHGQYLLHRIVYFMFHRRDPRDLIVDHINGDPADNRIKNLRCCNASANASNLRKKGKYIIDDDGVGKWVSGVVPS